MLACEPGPTLMLEGDAVDRALAAMGDFADLVSPYLAGHSVGSGRARGGGREALRLRRQPSSCDVRRAAFVHDIGRVAVPARIWQKRGPLTADEWEQVRLHAYHTERVLSPLAVPRRARAVATCAP